MALADSKPQNPPDAHCEPPQAPEATHVAHTCQEVLVPGLGPAIWDKTQGDVMGGHGQGTPGTVCLRSTQTAQTQQEQLGADFGLSSPTALSRTSKT